MKVDIEKCPECNADMYPRKVKTGPYKGKDGWGCPLCFTRLPENESKIIGLLAHVKKEFLQGWDEEISKQDEDVFDFWKKPEKKDKDDSDLSE